VDRMTYAQLFAAIQSLVPAGRSFCLEVETWDHRSCNGGVATKWKLHVSSFESIEPDLSDGTHNFETEHPEALLAAVREAYEGSHRIERMPADELAVGVGVPQQPAGPVPAIGEDDIAF